MKQEKVEFWSSWAGTSVVALGIVCLVLSFVYLQDNTERMQEWKDVHQQLSRGKWFEQYFAYQAKIEPLRNDKYSKHWAIERIAGGLKGYFTVTVIGLTKLEDRRQSYQKFIVHFRQLAEKPLVITKIEEPMGLKIIYTEPNR